MIATKKEAIDELIKAIGATNTVKSLTFTRDDYHDFEPVDEENRVYKAHLVNKWNYHLAMLSARANPYQVFAIGPELPENPLSRLDNLKSITYVLVEFDKVQLLREACHHTFMKYDLPGVDRYELLLDDANAPTTALFFISTATTLLLESAFCNMNAFVFGMAGFFFEDLISSSREVCDMPSSHSAAFVRLRHIEITEAVKRNEVVDWLRFMKRYPSNEMAFGTVPPQPPFGYQQPPNSYNR